MYYILLLVLFVIAIEVAYAEVYIPENDYKGYYNSDGLYTVVGKVVSTELTPVKPTIHLSIRDENNIIEKSVEWVPIMNVPSLAREIPFKIIIPEVKNKNARINEINVTFEYLNRKPISVVALYDNTLTMYSDHVKGRAINLGNETVYNIRIYAGAHALDGSWLDTSISHEIINELKPGESKPFTLYIDPIFYGQVGYYSCFGPSDPFVLNLTTTRNNEKFEVYSESVMWLYNQRFDEDSNTLYINASSNSTPLPMRINLRVPISSMNEKLQAYIGGNNTYTFQSMDEDGMSWHLTFEYPPLSIIHYIEIKGFDEQQFKYRSIDIDNSTRATIRMPSNMMISQPNNITLVFYNKTNDKLLKDIQYNIKLIQDNTILLDEDRDTINGIDVINYVFDREGIVNVEITINGNKTSTNIIVVPEFGASMLIMVSSVLVTLLIRYKFRHI
ncbi:MAG: hypothetical protein QW416_00905 [Candidatus Nitrosocaldaceae archaeon]